MNNNQTRQQTQRDTTVTFHANNASLIRMLGLRVHASAKLLDLSLSLFAPR